MDIAPGLISEYSSLKLFVNDKNEATMSRAMTTSALLTSAAMLLTSATVLLATVAPQTRLRPASSATLQRTFVWGTIDFQWPSVRSRIAAIENRSFVPENNLPLGLEIWKDKLFLTVPRRKPGVPATLTYVQLNDNVLTTKSSPKLVPYPDWTTNRAGEGITSTYRVRADECDRLWVVDTGIEAQIKVTPPQILVFDLYADKLLHRYYLKEEDYRNNSFLANIAVDVSVDACDDAFAYMPDLGSYAMVVYSLRQNDSWRVEHNYFFLDPLAGNFAFGELSFQWPDGVFGVALSAPDSDACGFRKLYFHALASTHEFVVSTRVLRNRTLANSSFQDFQLVGSRGERGQSTASFLDARTGVLFMLEVQNHRVTCWDSTSGHTMNAQTLGVVAEDDSYSFVYPSDVKVDRDHNLWFLTNNLPIFLYGNFESEIPNYFVYRIPVDDAIQGTPCESKKHA